MASQPSHIHVGRCISLQVFTLEESKRWRHSPVYGAKHPVHKRKVRYGVQERNLRSSFQKHYDGVERGFRFKVRAQRNNEVVDAIRGIVGSQDNGLRLPVVLVGIPIITVLADLGGQT